ncbi:MAG: hypothetical protein LBD92_01660 [Oscillospiraceae bacterium]|jgi:DNA invertase Pin-like site-specific DNA recombinase|nr:hypothetical protein [Oscillospiraceae bacterium]
MYKNKTDARISLAKAQGIAAAKAKGVRFGRPVKKPPENLGIIVRRYERGKLPLSDVLTETGLKEATFYRRLREYRAGKRR